MMLLFKRVKGVVHCPSEGIANQVFRNFTGLFAVKYPTRRLR